MSTESSKLLALDAEAPGRKPWTQQRSKFAMQIFSALLYGVTAISMNFVNKAALLEFRLSNILLLNQMVLALLVLPAAKSLGYLTYPAITRAKAVSLLPVTLLYVTNVAFALISLGTLNIVFYSSLKRLTPMITLVIKSCVTRKLPPTAVSSSVGLVVGGCIIAGVGDFAFDLKGYFFAVSSSCLQASYLLLVEYSGDSRGVDTSELMIYNAIWSVPGILFITFLTGELAEVQEVMAAGIGRNGLVPFTTMLLGCAAFGMLLNFAQFLCTMNNSALTTTVVGVLKGVAATALGFLFFGGVKVGVLNLTGITMNTAGGVWYTIAKYWQRQEQIRKARDVPAQ